MTGATIRAAESLTEDQRAAVADIEREATGADGVDPLDDQVRLDLEFGAGRHGVHLLVLDPGVVGYGHLVRGSAADPARGHLVVHPDRRRRGVGRLLTRRLIDEAAGTELRVWAHGDGAAARHLAAAMGFHRVRELWQLRRPLDASLAPPRYADGVAVRTFRPGQDDAAWVELNAAAFAEHPEQGGLTLEDLHERMAQPWFDARGFFLAERDGRLLGSHWTKAHPPGRPGEKPVGEVYAVGVHPSAQGLGLGKALTLTGLIHLRDSGLDEVMLYVDADNTAAVGIYQRLGFTRSAVDVMYAHKM